MKPLEASGAALMLLLLWLVTPGAAYQPPSNVTRGVYANIRGALNTSVWAPWQGGSVDRTQARSGTASGRCVCEPGTKGQGLSQSVTLNQEEARPIKIAGWSRAENADNKGQGWRYSVYVDFRYQDNTSWFMQVAPFQPGTHDWEYSELIAKPAKPVKSASLHVFLRDGSGTVWFDDLFLGEEGGPNLVRCPGFEAEGQVDTAERDKLIGQFKDLHANAIHAYLSEEMELWRAPDPKATDLGQLLEVLARQQIGVWLTVGESSRPIKDSADPGFPRYQCVNGEWGAEWTAALAKAARFPFAGLSLVPDEYNYNTGRLVRAYENHADPKVKEFYQNLKSFCDCPDCRARYQKTFGRELPEIKTRKLPAADEACLDWLKFRYDSTTDWLKRSATAIRAVNQDVRLDSLICVTPLCSDWWFGPGVAWDRAGYEAGLEYPTTDPYIRLHNYLGDSTHWYVTETTEHLDAASPKRRCGVVLEASRLRADQPELDPVERYGSALTAVWHGADELAYFILSVLTGESKLAADPALAYRGVQDVYGLLERIDPWLTGARPLPGVALLFSRASCDAWRIYAEAGEPAAKVLGHHTDDPRHAAIAQKEVLYYLLRQGYPSRLFYLDSVRAEELTDFPVVVVPFPLAVSDDRVALLRKLATAGKKVIVVSEVGTLDEHLRVRQRPALLDLVGLAEAPSGSKVADGITVYENLKRTAAGPARNVVFLPGSYGYDLALNRDNEKRKEKVLPSPLNPAAVKAWRAQLDATVTPLLQREVVGDDVEVAALRDGQGRTLLLCLNWKNEPVTIPLPKVKPYTSGTAEAFTIGPDQRMQAIKLPAGKAMIELRPQQALVARLPAP